MKKLGIFLVLISTAILTGCNNTNDNNTDNNIIYNHSDSFIALEYKTDEQRIEEIVPVEPLSKDDAMASLSDMTADTLDESDSNNGLNIDLTGISNNNENVIKVLNNLYIENNYTSHVIIEEVYSEIPELDGFDYYLAVRFDNNDVYVIYQSNDTAYAYKDEYGIY